MQIESKRFGNIGLIRITGRVDGETSTRFDWVCQEAIQSGSQHLVIDTSAMEYVSSLGLRSFISAAKALEPSKGKVLLAGLHGLPKQVFEITHLTSIFPLFETSEEAIASLKSVQSQPHWLTLEASTNSLPAFSRFVRDGAAEAQIPTIDQPKLELILEELLLNVSVHAYPGRKGSVEVGYLVLEPGCLRIEMCDTGVPFNPLEAPAPDLTNDIRNRPEGGLGLLLVKSLAHDFTYKRDPYRNIVTFELRSAFAAEA